ncbi:MAG TPA: prepilin peptidase [Blastocatellia bacterium]|nr:prepilin peptidase [Blastocatellia bacterium]
MTRSYKHRKIEKDLYCRCDGTKKIAAPPGQPPQAVAIVTNLVAGLLRRRGMANVPEPQRRFAASPRGALDVILRPPGRLGQQSRCTPSLDKAARLQDATCPMYEVINGTFGMLIAFLWGLIIGSFLTVVVHRVPRGRSIVRPGSHCPRCQAPIRPRDNIPVIGYLLLRGRCRACGQRISPLYPVIELTTAILFVVAFRQTGFSGLFILNCGFIAALIALAVIDAEHRILPDALTYPGFVLAVGLRAMIPSAQLKPDILSAIYLPFESEAEGDHQAALGAVMIALTGFFILLIEWLDYLVLGRKLDDAEAISPPDSAAYPADDGGQSLPGETAAEESRSEDRRSWLEWSVIGLALALGALFYVLTRQQPELAQAGIESLGRSLFGAAVGGGFLWFSRLAYFAVRRLEGVGFGDVKMMLVVGAYLGWQGAFMTILLGSILGSIYGVSLMIVRRERNPKMPFGLFLGIAALVALFVLQSV